MGRHRPPPCQRELRLSILARPASSPQTAGEHLQRKFQVGQLVQFTPGKLAMSSPTREYKIMRILPRESGEFTYRIKSTVEQFERVARESEISAEQKASAGPRH